MKKVLIVIHDMEIGGAQKSLLAFLESLADTSVSENYDVRLMAINPTGAFYEKLPSFVRRRLPPPELRWLGTHFDKALFQSHFSVGALLGEISWVIRNRLHKFDKRLNGQQRLWENWRTHIPEDPECYDIAISYMDGVPNYYVTDKIRAKKKVLWVHSEYRKQGYDPDYDRRFYEAATAVVTISQGCADCLSREFPACREKLHVLENITSFRQVDERSKSGSCPEWENYTGLKLLSVGRLNPQKGFDLAIGAARRLQEAGVDFRWLVAGEGDARTQLEMLIDEANLQEKFVLLGARDNPYGYMRHCDILVQPSRVEGRSIVLDEAKALCKPIIATRYTTVVDAINHGVSGWIVDMNPDALAEGIQTLWNDPGLRQKLVSYLQSQPKGNEEELQKYIQIMM